MQPFTLSPSTRDRLVDICAGDSGFQNMRVVAQYIDLLGCSVDPDDEPREADRAALMSTVTDSDVAAVLCCDGGARLPFSTPPPPQEADADIKNPDVEAYIESLCDSVDKAFGRCAGPSRRPRRPGPFRPPFQPRLRRSFPPPRRAGPFRRPDPAARVVADEGVWRCPEFEHSVEDGDPPLTAPFSEAVRLHAAELGPAARDAETLACYWILISCGELVLELFNFDPETEDAREARRLAEEIAREHFKQFAAGPGGRCSEAGPPASDSEDDEPIFKQAVADRALPVKRAGGGLAPPSKKARGTSSPSQKARGTSQEEARRRSGGTSPQEARSEVGTADCLRDLGSFLSWLALSPERRSEAYGFLWGTLRLTAGDLAFVLGPDEPRLDEVAYLFRSAPGALGSIVVAAARRALLDSVPETPPSKLKWPPRPLAAADTVRGTPSNWSGRGTVSPSPASSPQQARLPTPPKAPCGTKADPVPPKAARKKKADPAKEPAKWMTPYFAFGKDKREYFRERSSEELSFGDIAKKTSAAWAKMTDEDQLEYKHKYLTKSWVEWNKKYNSASSPLLARD